MLPPSSVSEDDRVLFLAPPEGGLLRAMAARLTRGLLVVLGSDEEVRQGRREHSDLDNVMFVAASAEEIPWQDGFFTQVLDPSGRWSESQQAAREISRVCLPK